MGNKKEQKPRKHRRWYKNNDRAIEKALRKLIRKSPGNIQMRLLAKEADISPQTFYNHYYNVSHAMLTIDEILIQEFLAELDEPSWRFVSYSRDPNGRIFYALLALMDKYNDAFCIICACSYCQGLLRRLMEAAYLRLKIEWLPTGVPAPTKDSWRVSIYLACCVEIIRFWGITTNCNIKNCDQCVKSLLRATSDAAQNRLR